MSDILEQLNDKQYEAVINTDGPCLVIAGAGSGKTKVLTHKIAYLMNEKNVKPWNILAITFTNKAAKEMKDRIRKKLINEKKQEQLSLLEESYITTFDSYSLSIVKKYHYLLNLPKNICITDSTLVQIKKEEILDNIFEELYEEKNEKFEEFISTFCTKDDKEIRNYLLNIYSKLELKTDKKEYLEKYK